MSEKENNSTGSEEEVKAITFSEFLTATPPNQEKYIKNLVEKYTQYDKAYYRLNSMEIQIHCDHDKCQGERFFRPTNSPELKPDTSSTHFVYYKCSNCRSSYKMYALNCITDKSGYSGKSTKFGEIPAFGPPTLPRLQRLIQPDRDLFFKGRNCEIHGLGIGAFAYYRRVVEEQKNRILDEIIKVANQIKAPKGLVQDLEEAKKEKQFSGAVDKIKRGMPESLLIKGHNPLTLLHQALSEGIHQHDDAKCLEMATSIRVVLTELSERLGAALKDDKELEKAVTKLFKKK